ncbi:hypothetical protein EHS25_003360 [Saitozyma podzolica]|uniref:Uncharacterized protein n=1 Tax=Saitozyma podzolica TaxID=1890683 RepID=A0A427Y8J8_9TREE|nr:hypothetical protein EHS25_003360 [Saitozyma podzolica]
MVSLDGDDDVTAVADKILQAFKSTPDEGRLLVAIAGPPGSGKSTLAYPLTDLLNSRLLRRPPPAPQPTDNDASTGIASPPVLEGDELAICVGLDGWHYSRGELDGFPDPVEAHWRRGAAFTFNLPSYLTFLTSLRLPLSPNPPKGIPFPTFDHARKDPAPSPNPILPRHRIVLVEGLYTLLDRPGWRDTAEMYDIRVFVDCTRAVCRERVIRRNFAAGIVESLDKCAERVDAVDMVNGEEVRNHLFNPTHIVHPADEPERHQPGSS